MRNQPSANNPIGPFDIGQLSQAADKVGIGMCLLAERVKHSVEAVEFLLVHRSAPFCAASSLRNAATARNCNCLTALALSPRTSPTSAAVRPSRMRSLRTLL